MSRNQNEYEQYWEKPEQSEKQTLRAMRRACKKNKKIIIVLALPSLLVGYGFMGAFLQIICQGTWPFVGMILLIAFLLIGIALPIYGIHHLVCDTVFWIIQPKIWEKRGLFDQVLDDYKRAKLLTTCSNGLYAKIG